MVYNIENGGILIQEEGRGCYRSKSKKRKLKTKNQSKLYFDEQEPSVLSPDRNKALQV